MLIQNVTRNFLVRKVGRVAGAGYSMPRVQKVVGLTGGLGVEYFITATDLPTRLSRRGPPLFSARKKLRHWQSVRRPGIIPLRFWFCSGITR